MTMPEPTLTRAEEEVAECLAHGWSYQRAATFLGIQKGTVYVLAGRIAAKLPNPEELKPYQLVYQWALRRRQDRKGAA